MLIYVHQNIESLNPSSAPGLPFSVICLGDNLDGRPGLPSPQFMKVSQVEIAAIDPDFNRGYRLYP